MTEKAEQTGPRGLPGAAYYVLQVFVGTLVAIILTFLLVGRLFYVDGPSMVPTLHDGNLMALQILGYHPAPGDVVALSQPFRGVTGPIVKRVIATGGQTVDIDYAAGTVSVDGAKLDEPYVNYEPLQVPWYENIAHITVPQGHVFVMGDNRNHSNDSRDVALGTVDARRIIGCVRGVLLPVRDAGAVRAANN